MEPELVVRYSPLNPRFGIYPVAVIAMAGWLCMLTAACVWLLFLSANQLLVLAGWGWGNLILIQHETRWLPVAGAGLAWLVLTLLFLWLSARAVSLWVRRARRAWWVRLTPTGFEVNDRIFAPRRYDWAEINQFMLVARSDQVRSAIVNPPQTFLEILKAGYGRRPTFCVGFECAAGNRALAPRLLGGLVSSDGTRADGVIIGPWDRHLFDAVDLMNDWLDHYRQAQ